MRNEKLEKEFGWEKLCNFNEQIGKFIGYKPKIRYAVGDGDSYCYNPDERYFFAPELQKQECIRWLKEQKERYPDGWVTKDGYKPVKIETYPQYHRDWNDLIDVVQFLKNAGKTIDFQPEIDITYKSILSVYNCL